jgi:hypothetical protein
MDGMMVVVAMVVVVMVRGSGQRGLRAECQNKDSQGDLRDQFV